MGYYKGSSGGRWVARVLVGGVKRSAPIGPADDDENGTGLTYSAAVKAAHGETEKMQAEMGRGTRLTLDLVRAEYLADLSGRGGNVWDAEARWAHVHEEWLARDVRTITPDDWRRWRDGLGLTPAGINRTATAIKAALAHALRQHPDLAAPEASWKTALSSISGAHRARQVVLNEADIRALIAEAGQIDADFHLLCVLAASTGARYGQLVRITVGDVQASNGRVLVPRSGKGRNGQAKKHLRVAVPVARSALGLLEPLCRGRAATEPLLMRTVTVAGGEAMRRPWGHAEQTSFMQKASRAALGRQIEFSTFRHSFICAALGRGTPVRVVAAACDTSSAMIERNYSAYILDATADLMRADQIDLGLDGQRVVPLQIAEGPP